MKSLLMRLWAVFDVELLNFSACGILNIKSVIDLLKADACLRTDTDVRLT